jgi:hypothetical protein
MSVKISGTASLLGSDYYLERRGVSRDLVAFVIDRNDDRNFGAIGSWLRWNSGARKPDSFSQYLP